MYDMIVAYIIPIIAVNCISNTNYALLYIHYQNAQQSHTIKTVNT
jgi:hypothetical protein